MDKARYRALYVHVPFCEVKCAYCVFYSLPDAPKELRRRYLDRLAWEADGAAPRCRPLKTLYVGGGTPSALGDGELRRLLSILTKAFQHTPGAEFTVECNPDSLTAGKVEVLAGAGVNRISLGVQSFDNDLRETLGRAGGLDGLEATLGSLRGAGIGNVGADLIYAIPGQDLRAWREDVRRACDLGVCHLSTYELTVEEGSRLAEHDMPPVGEDEALTMWHAAADAAGEYGLQRYEVSNLAKPGRECRHNDDIWHGATYAGLGPAAASYDGRLRATNPSSLDAWLRGTPPGRDELPPERRAAEVLGFGLRTVRGWKADEFRRRTGFDYIELRRRALEDLAAAGLLVVDDGAVRPTERGLVLADYVARTLL